MNTTTTTVKKAKKNQSPSGSNRLSRATKASTTTNTTPPTTATNAPLGKKKKKKTTTTATVQKVPTATETRSSSPAGTPLNVATWNIAAINNNPFEYWITYSGAEARQHEQLMAGMEGFIENPGNRDVAASSIFTEAMFVELMDEIQNVRGPSWNSIDFKRKYWSAAGSTGGLNLKTRNIISDFMKDEGGIGKKRLTSMPDRVTNVINPEGSGKAIYRPTVISMYSGKNCELNDVSTWWTKWKKFMFRTTVPVLNKKTGEIETKIPFSMLLKITKKKYPAITKVSARRT